MTSQNSRNKEIGMNKCLLHQNMQSQLLDFLNVLHVDISKCCFVMLKRLQIRFQRALTEYLGIILRQFIVKNSFLTENDRIWFCVFCITFGYLGTKINININNCGIVSGALQVLYLAFSKDLIEGLSFHLIINETSTITRHPPPPPPHNLHMENLILLLFYYNS